MLFSPRRLRNIFILLHDGIIAGASFMAALYLRWSEDFFTHAHSYWAEGCILSAFCVITAMVISRQYRRSWRFISMNDMLSLFKWSGVALLAFYALLFLGTRLEMLPRSIPVIHLLVLLAMMATPRLATRLLLERKLQLPSAQQIPVLLIGATQEAEAFIRESFRNSLFSYRAEGIVATEASMIGRDIHQVRVYGELKDLPAVVKKLERKQIPAQRIIIADTHLEGATIRSILSLSELQHIPVARLPKIADLKSDDALDVSIKPIEIGDILGRPQATLDKEAMRQVIAGRKVLITGAGGSIGSELVRQVAAYAPTHLTLVDQSEYNLYAIDKELAGAAPTLARNAILADIREAEHISAIIKSVRPEVVFHAAALKHVPLCEANPEEAMLTNVMGTRYVADACHAANVALMVQISTDKAVNPTNVMGACKRLAESYCQALGQAGSGTRFITVRFGNVLGSTGSVVPLFEEQLRKGGPLTITHPEMTRYFMTIKEAVQLVILSAAMGSDQQEQAAPIYVLDMGSPIRIEELALQMIRLAGLRPHQDIAISYVGLRAGEKLHEELFYDSEAMSATPHPLIHLAAARSADHKKMVKSLALLEKAAQKRIRAEAVTLLQELVPEYTPDGALKQTPSHKATS